MVEVVVMGVREYFCECHTPILSGHDKKILAFHNQTT